MKKKYSKAYRRTINKINLPMNIITRIFLSKFSPIKQNFQNKKILDFSCGSGPYLRFLKDLKFKVYATEISPEIVKNLKNKFSNIVFKVSDNNNINFKNNFFNYVLCNHSIYYLGTQFQKFEDTIKEVNRVTKIGGIIICTFPTVDQYHLKFKRVKNQIYKIVYDKYKIRKNGYFNLFENSQQIWLSVLSNLLHKFSNFRLRI